MQYFQFFALFICITITINSIANYFLLRRPPSVTKSSTSSIAVLLPVRNEEDNIVELICCLKSQIGIRDITFHIIDDNSTDCTFVRAQESTRGDSRFLLHRGDSLPSEWLGKPFALQQGYKLSKSEIIVLLDADVRIQEGAISLAVDLMERLKLDFISPYPRQVALTWAERLVQPLLQWSWMATVPLRIAERSANSALAVANGQFFLVRRSALSKLNGFESVKNQVLDDINLARVLIRSGFHGTVVDGSEIASVRMYKSWSEIENGYGKSLRVVFKSPLGFVVTISFLLMTGITPFIFAILGSTKGIIAFTLVVFSRVISARASHGRVSDSILHPISAALLIYLIIFSWIRRGRIQWKGRLV